MMVTYVAGVLGVVGGFRLISMVWGAMESLPLGVGSVATTIRTNFSNANWFGKTLQIATPALMVVAAWMLIRQNMNLQGVSKLVGATA
jgi:hypothetical protein